MKAPPDYWPWLVLHDYNFETHQPMKHETYDMPDGVKVIKCVCNDWTTNIKFKVDPAQMDP